MPKFRKKPVVIEAWQWEGQQYGAITRDAPKWVLEAFQKANGEVGLVGFIYGPEGSSIPNGIRVKTLEGIAEGRINIWLMKGVRDELYLCDPDIFAETYERVEVE